MSAKIMNSLGLLFSLTVCLILVGCGSATDALNATKSMPDLMGKTNRNMEITNQAIHKQTLLVALTELDKPDNSRFLNPPLGIMPAAQAFGAEATTDELANIFYVYSRKVAETVPDDTMVQKTPDGKWTADALAFDHLKLADITKMMALAGLAPQDKVEKLVQEQVLNSGRFEPYIYNFLTLRALFIKVYLVEEGLYAYKLTNLGMFEDALKFLSQIDYVAKLPFADKVSIQTTGLLEQELNLNLVVKGGTDDTNIFGADRTPVGLWQHMARSYSTELDPSYQKSTQPPDLLSRVQAIKGQIDAGNASWVPQPQP